jgi:hypothetical protein
MLGILWSIVASLGRVATIHGLLDYFRGRDGRNGFSGGGANDGEREVASNVSTNDFRGRPLRALVRLNFLRGAVALAALLGFVGASILAGFASPAANPRPGMAFILFLPIAALVCLVWSSLNWLLSLAAIFAVRDGEDTLGAISAAVAFCRERTGPVFAVSTWTGLAHLVAFVGVTTVVSIPMGFVAIVPWRLVAAAMLLVTLVYLALADWIYLARLAGYVCIVETPEALLAPTHSPPPVEGDGPSSGPPPQTSIDRDEPILSDLPNLAVET